MEPDQSPPLLVQAGPNTVFVSSGSAPASGVGGGEDGLGARVKHRYHDRTEDTIAVTHNDLREVRDLGAIHQTLFGVGMFFFSGAFWEIVRLASEQQKFEFTAWMGMYLVCTVAGVILAGVGAFIFHSKQLRLNKYFPAEPTGRH
jgi:hypothetical protein